MEDYAGSEQFSVVITNPVCSDFPPFQKNPENFKDFSSLGTKRREKMDVNEETSPPEAEAAKLLASLMQGNSAVAEIHKLRADLSRSFAILREEVIANRQNEDRWLDAKGAREYLGGMSESTFDKYRYLARTKIKGYLVGGKTLFKKSDLDRFVVLYSVNAEP